MASTSAEHGIRKVALSITAHSMPQGRNVELELWHLAG